MSSIIVFFTAAFAAQSQAEKRYFYLASPDGAQKGGSGVGLLVYDMDRDHALVRRIPVPSLAAGVRGLCGSASTRKLYYTTTRMLLGCLDLRTDKILWEKTYDTGCDQAALTPDARKLYVPSGWWSKDNCWMVVDAASGELLKKLPVASSSHNTIAGMSGARVYGAAHSRFYIMDAKEDRVLHEVAPVSGGHFPFTVNAAETLAFVCQYREIGFEIIDLTQAKVLHKVLVGPDVIKRRSHGVGLSPDEKELWVADQGGKRLYVFDATVMPPQQVGHVDLSFGAHGWVGFSIDGRFVYADAPDIVDAKSRKVVAMFKDEEGKVCCSSKYIEVHFRDGDVSRVGHRFALGSAR